MTRRAHSFVRAGALGLALAGAVLGAPASHGFEVPEPHGPETVGHNPIIAARSTPAAAPTPAAEAEDQTSFRLPALTSFAEVVARPLFSPDRKPRAAAGKEAASPPLPFSLRGIVVQPTAHYALIEEGAPPVAKRVREGESLGGGVIKEILRDRIVLDINNGETVVRLFEPSKANSKHAPVLLPGGLPSQLPPDFPMGQLPLPPQTSGG